MAGGLRSPKNSFATFEQQKGRSLNRALIAGFDYQQITPPGYALNAAFAPCSNSCSEGVVSV